MSSSIYFTNKTVTPATASPKSLVIAKSIGGGSNLVLDSDTSGLQFDSSGTLNLAMDLADVVERFAFDQVQRINVAIGTTNITIDISQGQIIEVSYENSISVTLSGYPSSEWAPVFIYFIRTAPGSYNPTIVNAGTKYEGRMSLLWSSITNTMDLLSGFFIDGTLALKTNSIGYQTSTGSPPNSTTLTPQSTISFTDPVIPGLSANSLMTIDNQGNMVTSDIVLGNQTLPNLVITNSTKMNLYWFKSYKYTVAPGDTAITLDLSKNVAYTITFDANSPISISLNFTNFPSPTTMTVIYILRIKNNAYSQADFTYDSSYIWNNVPLLTNTSGAWDLLTITSGDGGTTKFVNVIQNIGGLL